MYSSKSYSLTKSEYNYLLPAIREKLTNSNDNYNFIGGSSELSDMLSRLTGLYNNYGNLTTTICYDCFKSGNLDAFRIGLNLS